MVEEEPSDSRVHPPPHYVPGGHRLQQDQEKVQDQD